jgi:hypothetical protein
VLTHTQPAGPWSLATFRSDDAALVTASLSCQVCLQVPAVELRGDQCAAWAACHCSQCGTPTETLLTHAQAPRLVADPPSGMAIRLIG